MEKKQEKLDKSEEKNEEEPIEFHNEGDPFGYKKVRMICPHCNTEIVTAITSTVCRETHLHALIGFLICSVCCCCCFLAQLFGCISAYCNPAEKHCKHECPNCKAFLGEYIPKLGTDKENLDDKNSQETTKLKEGTIVEEPKSRGDNSKNEITA